MSTFSIIADYYSIGGNKVKKASKFAEEPHSITMASGPVEIQAPWMPNALGDLGMQSAGQATLQDRLSLSTKAEFFGELGLQLSDSVVGIGWQVSLPHDSSQLCRPPQVLTPSSYTAIWWLLLLVC